MAKSEHTFYKEAKKSFLSKEGFSWNKIWKSFLKYSKWALYLFLTVTTLWGCVNQFRHNTSSAVAQGIEFYSSYDSVFPNLYNAEVSSHTYEIYDSYENDEGENVTDKVPFEFYTINPNYNPQTLDEDNVNHSDIFIKYADITTSEGTPISSLPSYTFNLGTASLFLFNYNWDFYVNIGPGTSENLEWVLPWYSVPSYITENIDDINDDDIYNLVEFYEYIGFKPDDGSGLLTESDNGIISAASPLEKYIVPNVKLSEMSGSAGESIVKDKNNWEVINGSSNITVTESIWDEYDEEEKQEFVNNQIYYLTNMASFLTGNEFNSEQSFNITLEGEEKIVTIDSLISELYDNVTPTNGPYTASFAPLQDIDLYDNDPNHNYELYSGIGYSIEAQSKTSPLFPSDEAIDTFQDENMRSDNWYQEGSAGTQERTDNAGWTLLTDEGDFIKIYDQSNNENYFYADTQEDFNQLVNNYRTSEENENGYYVEDSINLNLGIDSKTELDIENYKEDFIGLSSIVDIDKGDDQSIQNVTYNSNLYDSIEQSGQDGKNSGRDIFASWKDWGDAWSPEYGPLYGMFIFPLSQLSLWVNSWFPYDVWGAWGVILGIFIITFLLRGLGLLLSLGSSKNQYKMQEVQPLLAEIDAKYSSYDKKNKQIKMKKQQEKMAIYKKHEVNPFASLGTIFITLPIFLALYTIISAIPIYKVASIGAFSFSASSFYGMFNISSMFIVYLMVGITVGFAQGVATKLPGWISNKKRGIKTVDDATKKALKKQRRTQNILVGVFIFIGLTVSVLLAIYWIFSALFSIVNELMRYWFKESKAKKARV